MIFRSCFDHMPYVIYEFATFVCSRMQNVLYELAFPVSCIRMCMNWSTKLHQQWSLSFAFVKSPTPNGKEWFSVALLWLCQCKCVIVHATTHLHKVKLLDFVASHPKSPTLIKNKWLLVALPLQITAGLNAASVLKQPSTQSRLILGLCAMPY